MARGGLQGIGHIPYDRDSYWEECCNYLGYECITKKEVYDILGYRPLPTLEKMHRSRATHRILAGGNRSGKTYGGMMEVMPYLWWMHTCGWVVSATYDLAEELRVKVEEILIERAGMERAMKSTFLKPWQFSYSVKSHVLRMGTGSWLQLKSADSPNSMHATPLDWVLIDEAALLPYILYDTRITPRLVDAGGWVLSMGTFEWMTGEWFEEYFDIGQVPNELGISSWEHPTEDNYHVYIAKGGETPQELGIEFHTNWNRITQTNQNVTWPLSPGQKIIIWNIDMEWLREQKNRIRPEIYAARFEAKRASNPYLVFPQWNLTDYVDADRTRFDPNLPVYLAVDPGGTYAVAAIQLKKFSDTGTENTLSDGYSVCVIDELYFQKTVTTQEVVTVASHREWWPNVARWPWPSWDPMQGAIDVMTKEPERVWEHEARKDERIKSLHFMSQKVNVQPGIQTLQHYLDTHSFFINPSCTFLNLEMRRWTYPPPSVSGVETEDPRRANPKDAWNHEVKAIIYFLVNKFGYYGRSNARAALSRSAARREKKERREGLMSAAYSRFVRRRRSS